LTAINSIEGFDADLFVEDRSLVHEGVMSFSTKSKKSILKKKKKNSYCFLFSDIFVYCEHSETGDGDSQYVFGDSLELRHVTGIDVFEAKALIIHTPSSTPNTTDGEELSSDWIMSCPTTEERDVWITKFKELLKL